MKELLILLAGIPWLGGILGLRQVMSFQRICVDADVEPGNFVRLPFGILLRCLWTRSSAPRCKTGEKVELIILDYRQSGRPGFCLLCVAGNVGFSCGVRGNKSRSYSIVQYKRRAPGRTSFNLMLYLFNVPLSIGLLLQVDCCHARWSCNYSER